MNQIKVNSITGQVAVIAEGVEPRQSNIRVYDPGMYKLNLQTGQIAVPGASGYEIHEISPGQMHALNTPEAIAARQSGIAGSISGPQLNPDQLTSAARGGQQGITLGTSDEIGGAAAGLTASALGDQAPIDPAHPVTGGMSSGFGANYLNQVGQERQFNAAAKAANPKSYKGAFFAGSLLPSMAMPANTIGQAAASGAAGGGLLGLGLADTQDPAQLAKSAGLSALGGGLLGGAARGLYSVGFEQNTPTGLAYNALSESAPQQGDIGSIQTRPSSAPAELDQGMSDLLRTAGAKNGPAAAAAIPGAKARLANVDQAITDEVGNQLSPFDSALLGEDLAKKAQAQNGPAYDAAYASPTRVGLLPEDTNRPSFQSALKVASVAAADEKPPRALDPTNLSAKDIDLIDRMLGNAQTAARKSVGDSSPDAQMAKALMQTRGEVADNVRQVADQAFPELASAREGAKKSIGVRDALDLGGTWLGTAKSPEQVGAEFTKLTPEQQQAALSGFATDIRNSLGTKTAKQNLGSFFERTGLAQKLRNVGVPDNVIDSMVNGGQGARQVVAALEGGSMTARNLAGAEAMQSTFSQVRPQDLSAGALIGHGNPMAGMAVSAALPTMRGIGNRAEQGAAAEIIKALATPGGKALVSLINRAPQTYGGLLNAPARAGGALLGSYASGL